MYSNTSNLNKEFANLNMQGNPSILAKPYDSTCDVCMWEALPESQRTYQRNWSEDVLGLHRSKHLPFMQQGVHYASATPFVTATHVSVFKQPTTVLHQAPIVRERIVNEVDVFPERVEVFERHVFPDAKVNIMEKMESVTEIEKEIVHVHPVKLEKEIVNIHPSVIEKEITHVQPVTVHVQETVVHPEQIVHETEEKVLGTQVIREQETDLLPTKVEYEQQQVFANDLVQQQTVREEFIAPIQKQSIVTETVSAPAIVNTAPIVPLQPVLSTSAPVVAQETVTTTTQTHTLDKDLAHHNVQTGTTTTKASGKKHGFLHKILHPHANN